MHSPMASNISLVMIILYGLAVLRDIIRRGGGHKVKVMDMVLLIKVRFRGTEAAPGIGSNESQLGDR